MQTLTLMLEAFVSGLKITVLICLAATVLGVAVFLGIAAFNDRKFPARKRPRLGDAQEVMDNLLQFEREMRDGN